MKYTREVYKRGGWVWFRTRAHPATRILIQRMARAAGVPQTQWLDQTVRRLARKRLGDAVVDAVLAQVAQEAEETEK